VEFLCILVSFICVTVTYLYVCRSEGSYLNVLTPALAFLIPADYLLESYHLYLFGPSGSLFAYVLVYTLYAGTFGLFALGYLMVKVPALRLPFIAPVGAGNPMSPYVVLAVAIALYAPVLYEFRGSLSNPREIYEQTRTGYGVFSFLSTTVCYVALILLLFKRRLGKLELGAFSFVCLVFLWLHGSKNQMLLVFFILMAYAVYVRRVRVSIAKFAVFATFLFGVGLVLFLLTNPLVLLGHEGLEGIASYSDYTRNALMLIDTDFGPLYGKLTLEQEAYSRIPRALFPGKPNDFGVLFLAEHFFPYEFVLNKGAPAFSFGTYLADFGPLALPILLVQNFIAGIILKIFMTGLRRYNDPGNFILVLFTSGLTLIPVSTSFILPESLLLALSINILHTIRLRPRRHPQLTQGPQDGNTDAAYANQNG
jgi:hypothetical protein